MGQWVQLTPPALPAEGQHVREIPRHLCLEHIEDALHHGIIALEHLLEVIEVIVIRGHYSYGSQALRPPVYAQDAE